MANTPLPDEIRVLLVGDEPADVQLAIGELSRYGLSCEPQVVQTGQAFRNALASDVWDVVLSVQPARDLTSIDALAALKATDIDPPLIIISRTMGEDAAADAMRAGAQDCVIGNGLSRLGPVVCREVSNRRRQQRTDDARLASEHRLRHAQKLEAVGRMAGAIAHDFNNLLTIILGFSEMLIEDLPAEGQTFHDAREVQFAAQRASRLTKQLLAFSRQQVLEPQVLDAAKWLQELQPMVERLIGEEVRCRFVCGGAPQLVTIDPGQFEQVIMNIVINARDAMPGGGRLSVELSRETLDQPRALALEVVPGPYVTVTVSDTGDGMDAATLEQIFKPFFTTKEPGLGTGLGLSTVFGIVRQSGGGIEVQSTLQQGTTFRVYFPHSQAAQATPDPSTPSQLTGVAAGTILLAEDEEGVRSLLETALERDGHRVISTGTGPEAVMAARRATGPIDLLITDVVMPGMSGPDVASSVASTHPEARVLFLSGYATHPALPAGLSSDPSTFLQKPFSVETLLAKVRHSLSLGDASRPSSVR